MLTYADVCLSVLLACCLFFTLRLCPLSSSLIPPLAATECRQPAAGAATACAREQDGAGPVPATLPRTQPLASQRRAASLGSNRRRQPTGRSRASRDAATSHRSERRPPPPYGTAALLPLAREQARAGYPSIHARRGVSWSTAAAPDPPWQPAGVQALGFGHGMTASGSSLRSSVGMAHSGHRSSPCPQRRAAQ